MSLSSNIVAACEKVVTTKLNQEGIEPVTFSMNLNTLTVHELHEFIRSVSHITQRHIKLTMSGTATHVVGMRITATLLNSKEN